MTNVGGGVWGTGLAVGGVKEFVDEGDAFGDVHGAGEDFEAGGAEEGFVGVAGVAVGRAAGGVAVDDGGEPGGMRKVECGMRNGG